MDVTNKLTVHRLNGDSYFRKKPVVLIKSSGNQYSNEKRVSFFIKVGKLQIEVDLNPEDVRKALNNADNK